jgi:hypothetical protein
LAKQEKFVSNSLAKKLGENRNLAKLTSPRGNIRMLIRVGINMAKPGGGEKRNKEKNDS